MTEQLAQVSSNNIVHVLFYDFRLLLKFSFYCRKNNIHLDQYANDDLNLFAILSVVL